MILFRKTDIVINEGLLLIRLSHLVAMNFLQICFR